MILQRPAVERVGSASVLSQAKVSTFVTGKLIQKSLKARARAGGLPALYAICHECAAQVVSVSGSGTGTAAANAGWD